MRRASSRVARKNAGKRGVELSRCEGRSPRARGGSARPPPGSGSIRRRSDSRAISTGSEPTRAGPARATPGPSRRRGDRDAREGRGAGVRLNDVRVVMGHGRVCGLQKLRRHLRRHSARLTHYSAVAVGPLLKQSRRQRRGPRWSVDAAGWRDTMQDQDRYANIFGAHAHMSSNSGWWEHAGT